jgi:hypothetical protein
VAIVVLFVVAAAAALVGPAAATPTEPTLTLDELQARLDAGAVTGYFLTVDQGTHTATIPMTVLSIVGGPGTSGALIMFSADMTDPLMKRIGTIAAGMSGSPLFVDDPGTDKLIGAVSYGDIFTLGGLALATPIEYMSAVEARLGATSLPVASATRTLSLQKPVRIPGDGIIRKVKILKSAAAAPAAPGAGVAVFSPLTSVQIGGLPATSRAYTALAAELERRGHSVVGSLGSGPGGWDPAFTTPLVGGAALAVMYTQGDLWAGAIGTVTYVNGDHLVAFGHPMDWVGPAALYLCNAQIDGIWADSLQAYKLGTPGAVRGAITQDRGSAIAGRMGDGPADVPVTSSVTAELDTTTSAASTTRVTRIWAEDMFGSSFIAAATSVPAYEATDRSWMSGSAETTTTVVVSDGSRQYTVHRVNLWDDGYDVLWTMSGDVYDIVDTLNADPYGTAHATIVSVDSQATISTERLAATVSDVSVDGGLRHGANTVTVLLDQYGQLDPVTVPVTLKLPADMPLEGVITVAPAAGDRVAPGGEEVVSDGITKRGTLAEVVDALNAEPVNDQLEVTFTPVSDVVPSGAETPAEDVSVSSTVSTGYVVTGGISKPTASLTVTARPARVVRYSRTTLSGSFFASPGDTLVQIYRRYRGQPTFVHVATVPVSVVNGSGGFTYRTSRLRNAAVFKVTWAGDDTTLSATARVAVGLRR